eukprot:UN28372
MRFVEAELCLRAFSWFDSTLKKFYITEFDKNVWVPYIRLGLTFLSEETFDLENMNDEKRKLIESNYGDWRQGASAQLRGVWASLSKVHHVLATEIVGDTVEAGRSGIAEVVALSVDMFYDMMKSEFVTNSRITHVEHQTIDEVDALTTKFFDSKKVLLSYENFFKKKLKAKFLSADPKFKAVCDVFLKEIDRLFGLLVSLKSLPEKPEFEDARTDAMFSLMDYLASSEKREMHLRYIYLCGMMQKKFKNNVEAGNCFLQYADMLEWDSETMMKELGIELAQSKTDRRISMYKKAVDLFLLGEAFEKAISVCQILATTYQDELFDIKQTADILQKQSGIWRMVGNIDRVFLSCYLVKYVGNFPADIKNKQFVYRSGHESKLESIRDFTDRIKKKYPEAEVKNNGNPIPEDKKDPSFTGQFIRITTLQVSSQEEMNGQKDKWSSGKHKKAPLRLVKYYRMNEIDTFFYTYVHKDKKGKKGENEYRSLWSTKTFIIAAEEIPSLRRRIPVKKILSIDITPLQNATDAIVNKNAHVRSVVKTVENDLSHNCSDIP